MRERWYRERGSWHLCDKILLLLFYIQNIMEENEIDSVENLHEMNKEEDI